MSDFYSQLAGCLNHVYISTDNSLKSSQIGDSSSISSPALRASFKDRIVATMLSIPESASEDGEFRTIC